MKPYGKITVGGTVWEDTTSYQQGAKERIPNTFTTKVGRLKIVAIRLSEKAKVRLGYSETWRVRCHDITFEATLTTPMGADFAFDAIPDALEAARKSVFNRLCGDIGQFE